MTGGTVKQFKDALEEMRKVYNFKDEKTRIDLREPITNNANKLTVLTVDEETQVFITMSKGIPYLPFEE